MGNILDTAKEAGRFNTLAKAIKAAGLESTLSGPGPFTVFAPTDQAFAALPKGTLDSLMKDPPRLKSVLSYHVLQGRVTSSEIGDKPRAKTVQGEEVTISTEGGVKVNDANVTEPDVEADNGVIHVIDRVIMPKQARAH